MTINSTPSIPAVMTSVTKGLRFEQRSLRVLREHLSMSLRRVGGKGDGGIDLQGWWWLPAECLGATPPSAESDMNPEALRKRIRVVAQCKAEEKKIGPRYIREFEGTVLRHSAYPPSQELAPALVGVFLSTSPFTKASLLQAYSSPIPLALFHLPETPQMPSNLAVSDALFAESTLPPEPMLPGTLVFNPALNGTTGLLRGNVEPRWERAPDATGGRPGIWNRGTRIRSWTPEGDDESSQEELP
ncbi:hypothetical protein C8Q78DRAFT_596601 [Trametes maxima]|nr:hypothetical protein C8Q78DRAFT_596601 [Trametes maxima]